MPSSWTAAPTSTTWKSGCPSTSDDSPLMGGVSLLGPEDRIEAVSEALDLLDALSVSVEDADAQTDSEQALFGEPGMPPPKDGWQRSRGIALFPDEVAERGAGALLIVQDFSAADCRMLGVAEGPEQDWVRLTQSQFAPVEITP